MVFRGAGDVGLLEERLQFQGYGHTRTGQGVTRSLSSGGSDHRVQQGEEVEALSC